MLPDLEALLVLLHVVNHLHEFLADSVSLLHGVRLAIDTDNRLGVRLAQVYPLVGEINLHTVNIIHLCGRISSKHLLHLHQDGIDIRLRGQVDAVLSDLIVGEGSTQPLTLHPFLAREVRKRAIPTRASRP